MFELQVALITALLTLSFNLNNTSQANTTGDRHERMFTESYKLAQQETSNP